MKSPFPGMDPYVERHWRDVHGTMIVHGRAALQRQLGGGLRARIDERLVVESPPGETRSIYPEVRVVEQGLGDRPLVPSAGVAVAEPLVLRAASEKARERFIEIVDAASGGRLVTVIELLSPSNKLAGDGRDNYRRKQAEVIAAGVNLVEVDLTRGGRRELACPPAQVSPSHRTTYLACVYRGFGADQFELYAVPLRERLPAIRIPLREADPDIVPDLQPLLDRAYEEGSFDDIDYRAPCVPPLEAGEAAWADEVLRAAGKR